MDFEDREPAGFERVLEGLLIEEEDGGYGYLARLAGVAVARRARFSSATIRAAWSAASP